MKLYDELAAWWPLLSPPSEYADEAAYFAEVLAEHGVPDGGEVLELGCGGGSNASYLKRTYRMTLTDLSPGMLEVSRALNPECEHLEGDLRDLRLDRDFDAVFVHDAICYMTTADELRRAMATAFVHCRPGGVALFVPDHVRESFETGADHGGVDGDDGRGLRYLEWTWDPDPDDTTYVVDYAYVLRSADGTVQVEHDRHIEGLFARAEWLRVATEVGFEVRAVPFEIGALDGYVGELFVGRRPATAESP